MRRFAYLALIAVAPATYAQTRIIDDFTSGAFSSNMVLNNGNVFDTRFNAGTMFGGQRLVTGTYNVNSLNQDLTVKLSGNGLEITDAGAGASGTVDINFSGYQAGSSSTSLLPYDRFRLDFLANSRSLGVVAKVQDTGGRVFQLQQTIAADPGAPQDFLFSNFTGSGSFDWGHVNVADFKFTDGLGGDFALGDILATNPVPEPATVAICGMGLAGMIARRKKKAT